MSYPRAIALRAPLRAPPRRVHTPARRRKPTALPARADERSRPRRQPGDTVGSSSAPAAHGLATRRVALPAYVMAYRYNGKAYRAIVHGQSVSCTFGDAPYSVWKILGVALGVIALIAIIVAVVALASQ